MTVNATIVVQALHFLCAYILLDRLLFRPVIRVILDQEHEEFEKEKRNQQEERHKEELLAKKNEQWLAFKQESRQIAPLVVHASFVSTGIQRTHVALDAQLAKKLRQECAVAWLKTYSVVRK